ncbi:MAG TPA: hypothetical protein VG936_04375 [Lacunisphaera sp.]|nr:hypothetical protein [Lacunisphaera sp.]
MPGKPVIRSWVYLLVAAAVWLGIAVLSIRQPPREPQRQPALGFDSGMNAVQLADALQSSTLLASDPQLLHGAWVRLRGIDEHKILETRTALRYLKTLGLRTCVLLRWPAKDWKHKYLPEDLREPFERGRRLGAAYTDLVDAWEIDNEPDLGFVPELPERYAAFLKANYLGLKAGRMGRGVALVLNGAMGLPPGPWLEHFAANDGFAYIDGFNYHYYGYSDDFTGVYRAFENALAQVSISASHLSANSASSVFKRNWPIFLSEIGYGMLSKEARNTKEGRLRQWRWFKSIGEQIAQLKIEGPMAFYLPPYLEYGMYEYGLTAPASAGASTKDQGSPTKWIATGIEYMTNDFGDKVERLDPKARAGRWPRLIGTTFGGNELTPAGAWWLGHRKDVTQSSSPLTRGVALVAPKPTAKADEGRGVSGLRPQVSAFKSQDSACSPIVIDFLPGDGLLPVKRFNGTFVTGIAPPAAPAFRDEVSREKAGRIPGGQQAATVQPAAPPSRSEEFIVQIRAANGNLFEVYPTRQATAEWQQYMEPADNFTMAFYGRAVAPWRFAENPPASLVFTFYPKQLPAAFEFRNLRLVRIRSNHDARRPSVQLAGRGQLVLYNFSSRSISGHLNLPQFVSIDRANPAGLITLDPGERREIPLTVSLRGGAYERAHARIEFAPDKGQGLPASAPSVFFSDFIPSIGGLPQVDAIPLIGGSSRSARLTANSGRASHSFATEEAPSRVVPGPPLAWTQPGATVEATASGFVVTITDRPPGKPQRVEVETPWPEGVAFPADSFLSLEFRLR